MMNIEQRWQRLYDLVGNLAHPRGDHCENELEDEAHDLIRELRALTANEVIVIDEDGKVMPPM